MAETKDVCTLVLNPYLKEVPFRIPSYRHGSHKHRLHLFLSQANGLHICDNIYCTRAIERNTPVFRCFQCNFDLCDVCFRLAPVGNEVPLEEHNHLEEHREHGGSLDEHGDAPAFDDRVFSRPLGVHVVSSVMHIPELEE